MSDHHQQPQPPPPSLCETDSLSSTSPMSSSGGRQTFRRGSKLTGLLMKTASPPQSPAGARAMYPVRNGNHGGGSPRSSLYHQHGTAAAAASPRQKHKPMYPRRRTGDGLDWSSGGTGRRGRTFPRPRPPVQVYSYTLVFLLAFTLGNFWSSVSNHLAVHDAAISQAPNEQSSSFGPKDAWEQWTESFEESAKRAEEIANIPKEDNLDSSTLDFLKQPRNWTKEQPPPPNTTVLFVIMSARHNFERRQTIRETWREGHESNVYFLVSDICWVLPKYRYPDEHACEGPKGHNSTFEQALVDEHMALEKEQEEHQDMIFVPREESYRSLVYKLKHAYKWAVDNVPKLKWVVKVDDDMVVRVQSMEFFLQEQEPISRPTVVGNIIVNSEVARDGKWKEFPSYVRWTYPPWPQGSFGHVVSYHLARFVASQIDELVEYQGEDTSLGIWIDENQTMKESVRFMHSPRFHNGGKCLDASFLIVGHEVSIERMRSCYEELDEVITHEANFVSNMLKVAQQKSGQLEWMDARPAKDDDQVVVIVFSERSNFLARQTIRDTWAATTNSSVYFVLGSECDVPTYIRENEKCTRNEGMMTWVEEDKSYAEGLNKTSNGILYEQYLFRDMYLSKMPEAHKEVEAYGLKAAYKWIVETIAPKARWIMKATDKMYVRLQALETMLAVNHSMTDVDQPIIIGEIVNHSEVWKSGPWADPDYAPDFYPPWPKGSCGQVVSNPVVRFVAEQFDKLYHYQGSDTSLAIWLDEFNVTVDFRNDMDRFKNDNNCFQQEVLVTGYQLPTEKLRQCFDNDVATGLVVAPNKTSSDVVAAMLDEIGEQ